MGVEIITDSTSYIPRELQEKYLIHVVPLSVHFGEESSLENAISNEDFVEGRYLEFWWFKRDCSPSHQLF